LACVALEQFEPARRPVRRAATVKRTLAAVFASRNVMREEDLPSVVKPPADRAGNAGGDRSSDVRAGTGATMSSTALAVASATVSSLPSCSQAQSA